MINITEKDLFPESVIAIDDSFPTRLMTRVFIWNDEGAFALVENKWPPHWFDLPGGGCDAGETLLDCTTRECMEEVGVLLSDIIPIGTCNIWDTEQSKHFDIHYFSARLKSLGERTTVDEREQNRKIIWLSPNAYRELIAKYISEEPRKNYQRTLLTTQYFLGNYFGNGMIV